MEFEEFKQKYLKVPVVEYPNNRGDKIPLVTVRILSYNHVDYVRQCIDSILAQKTNFDYEILIAEDESNDGTREICMEYAKAFPNKIRLLLNSRDNNIMINNKPSGLFNSVYSNFSITSKYIALCETDNYWVDEYSLQKRVDILEEHDQYVFCFHRVDWFDQSTQTLERNLKGFPDFSREVSSTNLYTTYMPTSTILYRNNLIEKFDEQMTVTICGDEMLRGKLNQFGRVWFCHDILPSVYRKHDQGCYSTESNENKFNFSIRSKYYLFDYFRERGYSTVDLEKAMCINYFSFFINSLLKREKLKVDILLKMRKHAKSSNFSFMRFFFQVFEKKYLKNRESFDL